MPLNDSDILWRPSLLVSDTIAAQNGGRMRYAIAASGVKNNLLPDVTRAEREAGGTRWRKAFIHVAPADDTPLTGCRVFIDSPTPAADYVTIWPGTHTDTQNEIASRPYGIGTLAEDAPVEADEITVICEHAAYAGLEPFRAGDLVRIGPPDGQSGTEQFVPAESVHYAGASATISLGAALAASFAAGSTVVSSVIERASIEAAVANVEKTSANGTFDATAGKLKARARGAVADSWLLTFTSASAFTIAGLATGAVGVGTIHADTAPLNPATGTPYWVIKMGAWGGTWQTGDTLRFDTHPSALAIWYRRDVPAGAPPAPNNAVSVSIYGESA